MKIKFHYSFEDDVLNIYTETAPSETIEFSEFLNIDVDNKTGIVGLEIFEASIFFNQQDKEITKQFLSSLKEIEVHYNEWRNMWFINLVLINKDGKRIKPKLPPLRKSEYVSPLIGSLVV